MGKCQQVLAAFKQEVLQYIEEKQCSVHAAYVYFTKVKKMDYTEGMYYQWHKKRESIMALPKTKKWNPEPQNRPKNKQFAQNLSRFPLI